MVSPSVQAELFKSVIKKVNSSEISTIKNTLKQILEIIDNPDSSAADMKHVIESDPPLSLKLMKLCNSAYYGGHKEISEIQDAIVYVGFDAVKEMALNQQVCSLFESDEEIHGYSRASLWKHCVAVGLCAKLIYRREFQESGNNIYLAGLLHDIGLIFLDQFLPGYFKEILKISQVENRTLFDIEKEVIGFSHTEVGKAIAQEWELGSELICAISTHHDPETCKSENSRIANTIFVADYSCQQRLIGFTDNSSDDPSVFKNSANNLNIKEKAVEFIMDETANEIAKMESSGFFR